MIAMNVAAAGHHHHATHLQPNQPLATESVEVGPEQAEVYRDLVDRAIEAREHAYAPNSGSMVGSAVLTRSGKVYKGANFETTDYADHGEQVALARALAAGEKPGDLVACATFVAKEGGPTPEDYLNQANKTSCGNCRQAIFELNPEMDQILLGPDGRSVEVYRTSDMLPQAYRREREILPNPEPPKESHSDPLIAQAMIARSRSYVPRSNEPVGAAVETASGHIYTGIRMETSSFSTQAERMALGEAMMNGEDEIKRLVLVGGRTDQGEIPDRITWDSFQAIASVSPDAQVTLPDEKGGFITLPVAQVPGFLLTYQPSKS